MLELEFARYLELTLVPQKYTTRTKTAKQNPNAVNADTRCNPIGNAPPTTVTSAINSAYGSTLRI